MGTTTRWHNLLLNTHRMFIHTNHEDPQFPVGHEVAHRKSLRDLDMPHREGMECRIQITHELIIP